MFSEIALATRSVGKASSGIPEGTLARAGVEYDDMAVRTERVLLIQPHADTREMYAEFLRYNGISTISVADGLEALHAGVRADVIVTGIRVPGVDGIELITRFRADHRTVNTPIIVLTACVFPADRERAAAAGCDVFLPLPCSPAKLLHQVRRLL